MATAKKTSKKTASRKPAASGNGVPEGFTPVLSGYAETWQPEIGDSISGDVVEVKTHTIRRGRKEVETRVMTVQKDDGTHASVWESALLAALFNDVVPGESRVYIRYDGQGTAKKGQNPPRLYTCGIA